MDETHDIYYYLSLPLLEFERFVKIEAMKGSGPGGQKINKTNSAVRATFLPNQLIVTSRTHRTKEENRVSAIRKIRQALAVLERKPPSQEIFTRISPYFKNGLKIRPDNPELPLVYAVVCGILSVNAGKLTESAENLGVTPTALRKFIHAEKFSIQNIAPLVENYLR